MPVRIVLHAPSERLGREAARAAFDRIAALEDIFSDYRQQSEVRRLEERAGEWVFVSQDLFSVLETAVEVARGSDGAFDPTIGPVVALWREARSTGEVPSAGALDSARSLVGWQGLALDVGGVAAMLERSGMRLDLGGVAKGYILQQAIYTLIANEVPRALVEAGGDIVVWEPPPGRSGWTVDVSGADSSFRARAETLVRSALATSGGTEQFVDIGGVRYSHVIDPRTGLGVTSGALAHVIGPNAPEADAIATALTILGPDEAQALLRRFPRVQASVWRGADRERMRPPGSS